MTITSNLAPNSNPINSYPVIVMTAGSNPVTAGGNVPGWVSGNITSMAVNTTVNCVFDLGPDWSMYKELQISIIPGWTAGQITYNCTASDSTTITYNRRLVPLSYGGANTTLYITSTTVSGNGGYTRPMGRYVIIQAQTNASGTSDGTGALTVTAYPGV